MRVLVAHNAYQSSAPSGENAAVLRDVSMLQASGCDVRLLSRSSDRITVPSLCGAGLGIRSLPAVWDVRGLLASGWRPQILHVHNLFPLLTTSPVRFAMRAGI